jgi:tetratricopeptide (TPR) repeat protein
MYPECNAARLLHAQSVIYEACLHADIANFRSALAEMGRMQRRDWRYGALTDGEQSLAMSCSAQCHHFLGEIDEAERDYGSAISLAPGEPNLYLNRARLWEQRGRPELAARDRERALELKGVGAAGKGSGGERRKRFPAPLRLPDPGSVPDPFAVP